MPGAPVYVEQPIFETPLNNGSQVVPLAGTPVPLSATSVPCIEVFVQVKRTNAGRIYLGGPGVANDDSNGILLEVPTATVTPAGFSVSARNLNKIFINSTINGDGVNFIYWL